MCTIFKSTFFPSSKPICHFRVSPPATTVISQKRSNNINHTTHTQKDFFFHSAASGKEAWVSLSFTFTSSLSTTTTDSPHNNLLQTQTDRHTVYWHKIGREISNFRGHSFPDKKYDHQNTNKSNFLFKVRKSGAFFSGRFERALFALRSSESDWRKKGGRKRGNEEKERTFRRRIFKSARPSLWREKGGRKGGRLDLLTFKFNFSKEGGRNARWV